MEAARRGRSPPQTGVDCGPQHLQCAGCRVPAVLAGVAASTAGLVACSATALAPHLLGTFLNQVHWRDVEAPATGLRTTNMTIDRMLLRHAIRKRRTSLQASTLLASSSSRRGAFSAAL